MGLSRVWVLFARDLNWKIEKIGLIVGQVGSVTVKLPTSIYGNY